MATINVKDATGNTVAIEKPLAPGQAAAAASRPVVLASDDLAVTALGAVTDAESTQGGTGTVSAKLRLMTSQLNTLAGYLDGVEAKLDTVNTNLGTIDGRVDTLETLIASTNTKLDTVATDIVAATLSPTHLGAVGGHSQSMRNTPAVDSTPDYVDGDSLFALATLANFARAAAGSGKVTRLTVKSLAAITVGVWVYLFDSNPSASTFTKNSALSIHANDKTMLLASIYIGAGGFVLHGATAVYVAEIPLNANYLLASGRDVYFAAEADGTINLASASDLEFIWDADND